jgi:large subunit ribosomal protein L10
MPKSKEQKQAVLEELQDKFGRAVTAVFIIYAGLSVKEMTELRRKLEEAGIDFGVYKLTLVQKAAKEKGIEIDPSIFTGPTAIAFDYADEIKAAKIIRSFGKEHEAVQIEGGIFQNQIIDAAKVKVLAAIPSKEELYAKLVWAAKYPAFGLVSALKHNLNKLVFVLNNYYQGKK